MKRSVILVACAVALALATAGTAQAGTLEVVPFQLVTNGTGTAARTSADAHTGSQSVSLTTTAAGDYAGFGFAPLGGVQPFSNITSLSFWFKQPGAGWPGPRLSLQLYDSGASQNYLAVSGSAVASAVWLKADGVTGASLTTPGPAGAVWWYGTWDGANMGTYVQTPGGPFTYAQLQAALPTADILGVAIYMGVVGPGVAAGSAVVDDPEVNTVTYYGSIQDAIDTAGSGDTVNVAAGTYQENDTAWRDLSITKSLSLIGAGSGSTVVELTEGKSNGVEIYSANLDVTVEGMTFTRRPGSTYGPGFAIRVAEVASSFTSLVFRDVEVAYGRGRNLFLDGNATYSNVTIANCNVHDSGAWGASIRGTVTGVTITDSDFEYNGSDDPGHGIGLDIVDTPVSATNVTVTGGSFSHNTNKGINLSTISNSTFRGVTANDNGSNGVCIWEWMGSSSDLCFCSSTFADNGLDGFLFGTEAPRTISDVDIQGCTITGNSRMGVFLYGYYGGTVSNVDVAYCSLAGNGTAAIYNYLYAATVDAEDNWWGTFDSGTIAAMVTGNVDYNPWLTTSQIHMAAGGARLVETQLADGGWAWWADGASSSPNIIGPTGMGLAKAYRATGDASMLAALGTGPGTVSDFLLAKTNDFSNQDGYLAAELDDIFGVTTHVDHLNANFYGPLAAGTYNKGGLGVLYSTATYVQYIRDLRESQGIPNLAAWDLGMALVAAASCGADTTAWIAGVKAEIDELDPDSGYETSGLGGAIYGLAFVGESYTAGGGGWCDGKNLNQLADLLVTFQVPETGGFAWDYLHVIPYDANESIQYTETAVKALNEIGGYHDEIVAAIEYISTRQLCTGGWRSYEDSNENNEVTAEAMWGLSKGNLLELNVQPASLYVKTNAPVVTDMDISNLLQLVNGCQAILGFDSGFLTASAGCVEEGSTIWDKVIYNTWDVGAGVPGEIDTAIGVWADGDIGTDVDSRVAKITLTSGSTDGTTELVFRTDVSDIECTWLSDMDAQAVTPNKVDSQTIVIDGTLPDVTVTSPNGGEYLMGGGSWTVTWTASDLNIDYDSVQIEYYDGASWTTLATGEDNDGTYTWDPIPLDDTNTAKVKVTVWDLSGNSNSDESDAVFTVDSTDPVVDDIQAKQGGGSDLTPSDPNNPALQGTVQVSVYVSDDDTGVDSGIDWTQLPTITVTDSAANPLAAGAVTADSGNGRFLVDVTVAVGTANGVADIAVSGVKDKAGNEATVTLDDTFYINKNEIEATVEMDTLVDSSPPGNYSFDRAVVFKATDAGDVVLKTWTETVTFTNSMATEIASGTYTLTDVPDATVNLSAKTDWSLRRRLESLSFTDGQATAAFTGANKLDGGDLNGSNTVNILDYSILVVNWYTTNAVADINGDGEVRLEDYSILVTYWFTMGDIE